MRPIGTGLFIRNFLKGEGPFDSPRIDPERGAPQAEIFVHYKDTLRRQFALDTATREEEKEARREKRPISPDEIERRTEFYLTRIPYKLTAMRYHSFVVYFSNLVRLGWVEFTGEERASAFQDNYPPGPPRRYFRLTDKGRAALNREWSNPLMTLYGDRWGGEEAAREHLRELRRNRKYTKVKSR
ncbi:hypothetical protein ES708_16796 [subsurface metagenome]